VSSTHQAGTEGFNPPPKLGELELAAKELIHQVVIKKNLKRNLPIGRILGRSENKLTTNEVIHS
jgi:hypothetical protein